MKELVQVRVLLGISAERPTNGLYLYLYQCQMYGRELLMMGREDAQNM
jgi:hypothetical protein